MANISLEKRVKSTYNDFKKIYNTTDDIKSQLIDLNNELIKINNDIELKKSNNTDIYELIKSKNEVSDKISDLKTKLSNIENNTMEMQFLQENGEFIDKYYDPNNDPIIEQNTKQELKINNKNNAKGILKFFTTTNNSEIKNINQTQLKYFVEKQYNNYINNVVTSNDFTTCENCGSENIINLEDNYIVCSVCGLVEPRNMVDQEQIIKESVIKTIYPYKRLNHFIEWLNQFQAKESIIIPMEIYNIITNELNKLGYTDKTKIKLQTIKFILKKYKLHKYYEHASYITSQLSGIPPPTLDSNTEKYLKRVFIEIEKSFNKHCPQNRINFLSYSYVLHKIFQLHGNTDVLIYFPLLKSKDKIKLQDEIWKNICKDLNWPFYPSI